MPLTKSDILQSQCSPVMTRWRANHTRVPPDSDYQFQGPTKAASDQQKNQRNIRRLFSPLLFIRLHNNGRFPYFLPVTFEPPNLLAPVPRGNPQYTTVPPWISLTHGPDAPTPRTLGSLALRARNLAHVIAPKTDSIYNMRTVQETEIY